MRRIVAARITLMVVPGIANKRASTRRWGIVLGVAALLVLAALLALRVAAARLPAAAAAVLGPNASIGAIEPGWRSIQIRDVAVRADDSAAAGSTPRRWPAEYELRAARITLVPEWSSLWRSGWRLARVEIDGGYLSMLRPRDGSLQLLPSLQQRRAAGTAAAAAAGATPLHIGTLTLRDTTLDLFDATVPGARGQPHRLRLVQLHGEAGPLALPALDGRIDLKLDARFDGPRRDGRVQVSGQLAPATGDADLALRANGVDLVALQPYLLRRGEAAVRGGTLDLTLDAKVQARRLHAPGQMTLHRLELDAGSGLATFAGLPRQAVLAAMSRDGSIALSFTLEGRVDDPQLSINELFAARFAVGLAEKLGLTLGGAVEGVGELIKGLFGR